MIPCSLDCKYQTDGYCSLNRATTVNSTENDCPHYDKKINELRK